MEIKNKKKTRTTLHKKNGKKHFFFQRKEREKIDKKKKLHRSHIVYSPLPCAPPLQSSWCAFSNVTVKGGV
jgi:hypothetical protein